MAHSNAPMASLSNAPRPRLRTASVHYADAGGRYAPLGELFFSGDAKQLVSAALESSSLEVDAVYCPECLELVSESDAAAHRGRCARCVLCPACGTAARAALLPAGGGKRWAYACGHCSWSSLTIGLSEESPAHLAMTLAQWESDEPRVDAFARALAARAAIARGDAEVAGGGDAAAAAEAADLETEEDAEAEALGDRLEPSERASLAQRDAQDFRKDARALNELAPRRPRLAPRCTRRCRFDVDQGRAGIVYKPKPQPLDGDSSSRAGAGVWAKKDASAHRAVPGVALALPPRWRVDGRGAALYEVVLAITNPTRRDVAAALRAGAAAAPRLFLSPDLRACDWTDAPPSGAGLEVALAAFDDLAQDDDDDGGGPAPTPRDLAALVADGADESAVLRTRGHAAWVRLVCAASGGAARPHARDAALRRARRRLVAVPLALAADGLDLPLVVALPAPEDPEAAPPAAWTALDCAVAS